MLPAVEAWSPNRTGNSLIFPLGSHTRGLMRQLYAWGQAGWGVPEALAEQ